MASTQTSEAPVAADALTPALSDTFVNADGSLSHAPTSPTTATSPTAIKYSTVLTPAQLEHSKTRQQKAEDVIYTLNHSITCLSVTDAFLQGAVVNWWNSRSTRKIHGHEHNNGYSANTWVTDHLFGKHTDEDYTAGIDHKEDHRIKHDIAHNEKHIREGKTPHPDPAPKLTPRDGLGQAAHKFWYTSRQWLMAEAVGDIGAVPVTIAIQRRAPGLMHTLRQGVEATVGGIYRWRTTGSAKSWGEKNGFAPDSQEVKDRQHELYEYEISHMPQMIVWTITSVIMNFGAMHMFHHMKPNLFEKTSVGEFLEVKGIGAAMTAGLVVGVRGLAPAGAHWWDKTMGKNVVMPIASIFTGKEAVETYEKNRDMIETGSNHLNKAESPKVQEIPATPRPVVQGGATAADQSVSVERMQHAEQAAAVG